MQTPEQQLQQLVRGSAWLMAALRCVRSLGLARWCIGGGAVRDLVWNHLHGLPQRLPRDIDVVYFDAADPRPERDRRLQQTLIRLRPDLPWEVTNQAGVHLWLAPDGGRPVPPLRSLEDGLAGWPETATAVGIRLHPNETLQVLAPLGLADLFAGVVRHNAGRVSAQTYRRRCADKRYAQRWPRLRVLPA